MPSSVAISSLLSIRNKISIELNAYRQINKSAPQLMSKCADILSHLEKNQEPLQESLFAIAHANEKPSQDSLSSLDQEFKKLESDLVLFRRALISTTTAKVEIDVKNIQALLQKQPTQEEKLFLEEREQALSLYSHESAIFRLLEHALNAGSEGLFEQRMNAVANEYRTIINLMDMTLPSEDNVDLQMLRSNPWKQLDKEGHAHYTHSIFLKYIHDLEKQERTNLVSGTSVLDSFVETACDISEPSRAP